MVDEKQKSFDAKRVEAMAEERGVEGTGKVGQGPQFRARKTEEAKLQDEIKIADERLRDAERPLRSNRKPDLHDRARTRPPSTATSPS